MTRRTLKELNQQKDRRFGGFLLIYIKLEFYY